MSITESRLEVLDKGCTVSCDVIYRSPFVEPRTPSEGAYTVPILMKAIGVLRAVAAGREAPTTKMLQTSLGLPHSTCYRILQTFVQAEWLRPLPGGRFALSAGLLPFLEPLAGYKLLIEQARGPLAQLSAETRLTVKLSVRQGSFATTIFRVESPAPASVSARVGTAYHLAYGSSGAVLLSDLPPGQRDAIVAAAPAECWRHQTPGEVATRVAEYRETGQCCDLGQYRPDHHALSAGVRGRAGELVAAVTLVGFPQEICGETLPALKAALRRCASALSDTDQAIHRSVETASQPLPTRGL